MKEGVAILWLPFLVTNPVARIGVARNQGSMEPARWLV